MPADRTTPTLTAEVIARAALRLLNEVGLDGLTMRLLATDLDVQAAALYWHVTNKQHLLDTMATVLLTEAAGGHPDNADTTDWQAWLTVQARRLHSTLSAYRDGARVLGGTTTAHPAMWAAGERALRVLVDGGCTVQEAAGGFAAVLHYTIGFVTEEQARTGRRENRRTPDAARFPLLAHDVLSDRDADARFDHGLRLILAGMAATRPS